MTDNPSNPTKPKSGKIDVTSIPDKVPVQLDGEDTGMITPVTLENIEPGRHKVTIELPHHRIVSRDVIVAPESTISVFLRKYSAEEMKRIHFIGYYTVGCVIVLIAFAFINRQYFSAVDDLTQLFIYVACAGGLGSLAFSIFGYINHLGKDDFDLNFTAWYILRPFIGIIYGTFAFLFIAGGLMTLSGVDSPSSLFTTKTVMFYCALAFLSGYAEYSFSLQLKELAEALFKKGESSKEPQGK